MCTYLTHRAELAGSAKGPDGWFAVTQANVYVDHPFDAPYEHTLNIDFADPAKGPAARVAVELTEEAALALVDAIKAALAAAPPGLASASASVRSSSAGPSTLSSARASVRASARASVRA